MKQGEMRPFTEQSSLPIAKRSRDQQETMPMLESTIQLLHQPRSYNAKYLPNGEFGLQERSKHGAIVGQFWVDC